MPKPSTTSELAPTALQLAANLLLGENVIDRIIRERAAGVPLRRVVRQIATDTDGQVDITEQTAREWLTRASRPGPAAKAAS